MSIGMNHCKVCSSPALEQKTRMLLGTALTVACTDTLVTLAKGWLCWDDERAVQEFCKEIRVTMRKAKRGEQAVKVVSCIACGCIQHNLYYLLS